MSAPWRPRKVTRPRADRRCSASRTGVRETPEGVGERALVKLAARCTATEHQVFLDPRHDVVGRICAFAPVFQTKDVDGRSRAL